MTNHFPLSQASLCADCGHIVQSLHLCHACGSINILPLAPVLNRPERYEAAPGYPPPCFAGPAGAYERRLRDRRAQ